MRRRVALTVTLPTWVLIAGALLAVAVLLVVIFASTESRSPSRRAGYGGAVMITFVPSASPADRTAVLSNCGKFPGVISYALTGNGSGTMTIPPAGESGVSDEERARHQGQRERIYDCLKRSPFVASTVEGL